MKTINARQLQITQSAWVVIQASAAMRGARQAARCDRSVEVSRLESYRAKTDAPGSRTRRGNTSKLLCFPTQLKVVDACCHIGRDGCTPSQDPEAGLLVST